MRILLIEDDEEVAKLVRIGMADANHVVTHAADGKTGMETALQQRFDVMIFDRQLPGGIDGADLLRDLRGASILTPALILSGLGGLCAWMQGLESGGDDYLEKPFNFTDLLSRVEALHHRHAGLIPGALG
jgi:two-component system OmpR family response regulator